MAALTNGCRVLVVEDDGSLRDFLFTFLAQEGYAVDRAKDGTEALDRIRVTPYDVVIADIVMAEVDGVQILHAAKARRPETVVILISGQTSNRRVVELIKQGADDYFKKPFDADELLLVVERALERRRLREENLVLQHKLGPDEFPGLIGSSPAMRPVYDMIAKVAETDSTVLVQGESGTGKELVARAIHEISRRRQGPFLVIHCGAIPATLIETELFGHEKGAFTGAYAAKPGLFDIAHRGTILLDEVGEIALPVQVKLLRVLENGVFRRVGSAHERTADCRIVAATNIDLKAAVQQRQFREDLFYRLNVFPVHVPPLRERREDIPPLANHFLDGFRQREGAAGRIALETMTLLKSYHWPGNVRELENVIERAAILSMGEDLTPEVLPLDVRRMANLARSEEAGGDGRAGTGQLSKALYEIPFRAARHEFERTYLRRALARADGKVAEAARRARISRAYFYEMMKRHEVK